MGVKDISALATIEDQPMCSGSDQIVRKLPQAPSPRGFVAVMATSGVDGDRGASGNDPIGKFAAPLRLLEVQFALP